MRIIFLSSDISEFSGWGRYTRELCMALFKKNISFEVHLPPSASRDTSLPFAKSLYYDLPPFYLFLGKRWWRYIYLWWKSHQIAVKGDIIHSLVEHPYGVIGHLLSEQKNIPFGITLHGTYAVEPLRRKLDRSVFQRALQCANFLVAVSRFTASKICKVVNKKLPVTIIHNGVNYSYFANNSQVIETLAIRKKLGIPKDAKLIISVGAFKERKGIDILLQAFAKVLTQEPLVYLIVIGSGDPKPYIELSERLGILEHVYFLKNLSDRELLMYYHACNLFALLPREDRNGHFEGFGLVYLEANACGKPVIGTWSGGVPEAVKHEYTGLLVPPDDPEAAAEAMLLLLRDNKLAEHLGMRGRIWAQRHEWRVISEKYIQIYKNLLE